MPFRFHLAAVVCLALLGPALANGGAAYVAGIGDLPLMDGLIEDPDAAIIYDKPEGRIVEAVAHGNVTSDDVESFYRTTLVQLGWQATGDNLSFAREGELLIITVDESAGNATVSFSLAPR
jgi:hypothetical protein